jgi:hypothetical protein
MKKRLSVAAITASEEVISGIPREQPGSDSG